MEETELNKVFLTMVGENPNNGSLLIHLVTINDADDLQLLLNNNQGEDNALKLLLDTENQTLSFHGQEFSSMVKMSSIPFKYFKVMVYQDANLLVFISEFMCFNFIAPINDSFNFLLTFLEKNHFQVICQETIQQEKINVIQDVPTYLN